MIAATVASMIPSILPAKKDEKRANEVITQTGSNYYRRQTWRTRGKDVYPIINKPKSANYKKILLYVAIGLGGIILIKTLIGGRKK